MWLQQLPTFLHRQVAWVGCAHPPCLAGLFALRWSCLAAWGRISPPNHVLLPSPPQLWQAEKGVLGGGALGVPLFQRGG